jgi:hypothetical protein
MKILFQFLLLIIFLVACGEKDKPAKIISLTECQSGNWETIGYNDSFNGKLNNRFSLLEGQCATHGVKPSFEDYQKGFEKGKMDLCNPKSAFVLGVKNEEKIINQCPNEILLSAKAEFDKGFKIYKAKAALDKTTKEIDKVRFIIEKEMKKPVKDIPLVKKLNQKLNSLETWEKEQRAYLIRLMIENELDPNYFGKDKI